MNLCVIDRTSEQNNGNINTKGINKANKERQH